MLVAVKKKYITYLPITLKTNAGFCLADFIFSDNEVEDNAEMDGGGKAKTYGHNNE